MLRSRHPIQILTTSSRARLLLPPQPLRLHPLKPSQPKATTRQRRPPPLMAAHLLILVVDLRTPTAVDQRTTTAVVGLPTLTAAGLPLLPAVALRPSWRTLPASARPPHLLLMYPPPLLFPPLILAIPTAVAPRDMLQALQAAIPVNSVPRVFSRAPVLSLARPVLTLTSPQPVKHHALLAGTN